jgi:carbonic anhydrase/acetyltransferase-like protein (isoleucine patch superfamily)
MGNFCGCEIGGHPSNGDAVISNLREDEQHQHKNGGGFVANTARVADTVFVGPHALVYGQAELSERVCVVDSAQVSGHAVLSGDVIVSGNAWVSGTTKASTGRIYKNERVIQKAERIR